ncbi:MAG: Asp23/Gls24 family envelope stress response protein [Clostridia bacterium]|nr:Asp23/Gls24 family envelope stress response protein [Clostridia bacterium]MBR5015761.1 Asp23/Gls24 family envelope stress response protein [Clostridia bacterium]MBR6479302.1 Asp23/Gls24 family envelope stress response protein [Clostridia bacterium]MBR6512174.1 Asp23/Gls24 family envelope stress response protein [Clostridia bacterium]
MAENNYTGGLVISEDVIATIAMNAAKDVDGVAGFGNRPKDLYTSFKVNTEHIRHVKVDLSDYDIKLHMYIIVNPSAKLQDTSMNVQKAVKAAVQNMTGRVVTKVDVTVSGIAADDEESEP